MQNGLQETLEQNDISKDVISDVLESGFYLRDFADPFSGKTWQAVSDMMYGSKQFSSHFPINEFVEYLKGKNPFGPLAEFVEYTVRNIEEIEQILSDPRRSYYVANGLLSFRGQKTEYRLRRKVPSPVRANSLGENHLG